MAQLHDVPVIRNPLSFSYRITSHNDLPAPHNGYSVVVRRYGGDQCGDPDFSSAQYDHVSRASVRRLIDLEGHWSGISTWTPIQRG
jgi:hypothetical protein